MLNFQYANVHSQKPHHKGLVVSENVGDDMVVDVGIVVGGAMDGDLSVCEMLVSI